MQKFIWINSGKIKNNLIFTNFYKTREYVKKSRKYTINILYFWKDKIFIKSLNVLQMYIYKSRKALLTFNRFSSFLLYIRLSVFWINFRHFYKYTKFN